ncbi:MAG: hypothetical protein CMG74_10765 [Candidatus Marinimicrobia bacterium]|nr:hypothetical protein [Candidatus Neomarinimicrobiota bacterium]
MKKVLIYFSIFVSIYGNSEKIYVEMYTLDNGMTVILNQDNNESSVFGAIAVKGGGKQDPADATGIAHYLEHMLFKGTSDLGTVDYASEKVFLDSIEILYDQLGITTNADKRLQIQKKINNLNIQASEYAIPNEFDRLVESIGGTGVNAFTNDDMIVYISSFPGHQINKWLDINSHRFVNPVFRLFQSELETVYEEKNRAMDNMFRKLVEEYLYNFFKKHPYGQQTVIGTVDHLKNPSLSKMKDYYDKYYVANNMYLMLSGDFNVNGIKEKIEKTFGKLKSGESPSFVNIQENPFRGREVISKRLTPIRIGIIGFRMPNPRHRDYETLMVIQNLFNNRSSTGLLDRLTVENKLLATQAIPELAGADLGGMAFLFIPKLIFQTFNGAENLVLDQIQKVKDGEFDNEFFEAIKLSMIQDHESALESTNNRLNYFLKLMYDYDNWDDIMGYPDRISGIDKEEVIRVANKYFGNDYLVLKSRIGFPKKTKLEKPPYKSVKPKNNESKSNYSLKFESIPEEKLTPRYIDTEKDVLSTKIADNYYYHHAINPVNSIFTMRLEYGIGSRENSALEYAAGLLSMIGNNEYTFDQFKEELQKIGATIDPFIDRDYFGFNIRGFDKYFDQTIELAGSFLSGMNVREEDEKKLKKLIQGSVIERKFEAREPSAKGDALKNFSLYRENSRLLTRATVKEVKKMDHLYLLEQIKDAMLVETNVFYTGSLDNKRVIEKVKENIVLNENLRKSQSPIIDELKLPSSNTVYFYNDKKAVQSQVYILTEGSEMSLEDRNISLAFDRYFGAGMAGIVFQEIREFRSLAYSARGTYQRPYFLNGKGYFQGYMGNQADKTIEALEAYLDLLMNMPEKSNRTEKIKSGLIQSLNSKKPNFRVVGQRVKTWKHQGYKADPRIIQNEHFQELEFQDIIDFYQSYIKKDVVTIAIVGDKRKIDMEKLSKFGKIIEVSKKDIFN